MLSRFSRIRGFRLYRDFEWPNGLVEFDRYNLIYAPNGAGKSSLAAVFKGIELGELPDAADVRFRIDGQIIHGCAEARTRLPHLRVFDTKMVHRLFADDVALAPVFYGSEADADAARDLERLRTEIAALEASMAEGRRMEEKARSSLSAFLRSGARTTRDTLRRFDEYGRYEAPRLQSDLDALAASEMRPAPLTEDDRRDALAIIEQDVAQDRVDVVADIAWSASALVRRAEELVGRSVVGEALVALAQDAALSEWVQEGWRLHSDSARDTCGFCGNPVSGERRRALERHFSNEVRDHQAQLERLAEDLRTSLIVPDLPKAAELATHLRSRYQELRDEYLQANARWRDIAASLLAAVDRKRANPAAPFSLSSDVETAGHATAAESLGGVGALLANVGQEGEVMGTGLISGIQSVLQQHNEHVSTIRERQAVASRAIARDHAGGLLDQYLDLCSDVESQVAATEARSAELAELQERVRSTEGRRSLAKPAEDLTRELAQFLGRDELAFRPSAEGFEVLRGDGPAAHLSDGERTAIAFVHFLKMLQDDSFDLANGVIVIDDPVSSFDSASLYAAFAHMRERVMDAKQVFILTHSFEFFQTVKGWLRKGDPRPRSRFFMVRNVMQAQGRCAVLALIPDALLKHASEYHFLFHEVWRASRPDGSTIDQVYVMPNVARRFLESFAKFRLPHVDTGKDLGGVLRSLTPPHVDGAMLVRVERFLNEQSHADRILDGRSDFVGVEEAAAVMKDLLRIVELADRQHYDGMLQATAGANSP